MVNESNYSLEVVDIHKAFFNNPVLKGVSFGIEKGEVLGLLGSNGAGKSTVMKIVNGVYRLDSGKIRINGNDVFLKDALDARKHGIAMVYQEFSVIPTLTVMQNLFLGREIKKNGLIDDKECYRQAQEALREFGIDIDPNAVLEDLSIGNQQLVEIVKALMQKPSVLILDEPTASLTHREIELLFLFIHRLKKQNIAVFLISHHMQEIMQICDRVVILRNGTVEMNETIDKMSIPIMVQAMIGRKLSSDYIASKQPIIYDKPLLEVNNLKWENKVNDVSFQIFPREVLGIAGLLGSGRTELMKCIYGLLQPDSGKITLKGTPIPYGKPWESIEKGIMFVPENRRKSGIIGIHSIKMNMLIPIWKKMKKGMLVDEKKSMALATEMSEKLNIKCTSIEQELESLSGGNQQKVVFGKSMLTNPEILLLDDPTVGIDVEAKAGIARLIRDIADGGSGVVLVSSEMDELERLCDRVLIIREGKVSAELRRDRGDEITESVLAQAIQM
ncbi:sugar ABC transporter ATP-binding protein [Hydrogenoanaerobacterium sp.]|uniref:sugar ABC transporter ATP-binding protein n=1 Tax=Hydrogenoanaerobacterium sp. TaxID=2953763 RepID=UPI002896D7A9|nr:sugar ABC transporter ATP-binding protein [Hydrogenoanaerobacterium sp.]